MFVHCLFVINHSTKYSLTILFEVGLTAFLPIFKTDFDVDDKDRGDKDDDDDGDDKGCRGMMILFVVLIVVDYDDLLYYNNNKL